MVHIALHEHVGEGRDDGLYARGQAHGEYPPQHRALDAQIPPHQPVDLLRRGQQPQRQHGGDQLGEYRRPGHARDARLQPDHEGQIQHDVQTAGQHQEHQRPGGVAHGAEYAAADVVDQQPREAPEVDGQVGDGVLEHVVRRGHQPQHGPHAGDADQRENAAQQERDRHGGLHGAVEPVHVPGPEVLGDHHARAHRKAVEEEHQHVHDHRGGAHGGQRLLAHEIAHDDAVHRVVHHLEDVAQHQRQREQYDLPHDGPGGHVSGPVPAVQPQRHVTASVSTIHSIIILS